MTAQQSADGACTDACGGDNGPVMCFEPLRSFQLTFEWVLVGFVYCAEYLDGLHLCQAAPETR